MPPNKHQPEEIVVKLRQVDVLLSQGRSVGEAVRSIGVTQFSCVTNSSTAGFSTVSPRRRSSSKLGAAITIPSARTHTWVQAAGARAREWPAPLRTPATLATQAVVPKSIIH
jgi:hypothetical protein